MPNINDNEKTGIQCKGWIPVFVAIIMCYLKSYESIESVHFVDLFALLWYKKHNKHTSENCVSIM